MRTGFGLLLQEDGTGADDGFMRFVATLLGLLQQDAMETALRLARCCGRTEAAPRDMIVALQYQVHEFLSGSEAGLSERFAAAVAHQGNEEGEDEEEDEGEDDEEEDDEEEDDEEEDDGDAEAYEVEADPWTNEEVPMVFETGDNDDRRFHDAAMTYAAEWAEWEPEDSAIRLLKTSLDSTIMAFGMAK